jgi:type IV secretory pathway VirB10-like protein
MLGQPVTSELNREPQSVKIGEAPPAPTAAPGPSPQERDMAARERRLAARVAALEAREKQLRQKEQPAAARKPAEASAPTSAASAASAASAGSGPGAETTAASEAGAGQTAAAPGAGSADAGGGAADSEAPSGAETEPPPFQAEERPTSPVSLPAGTTFEVAFTRGLASNTSSAGETFRARLLSDLRVDGATAIPAGSEILGVVTDAVAARRIGGQAKLTLRFTDLVLPTGSTVPIHASFVEEAKSKTGRDAATIGGSTAGGALLGRILGNSGRGTILGALVGAAVGTAIASKTAGEEVVIPEGSLVKLKLDAPLEVKPHH